MTRRWSQVLPKGFLLAAKVPRVITHEKVLQDCGEELRIFLEAMDHLGDRLGPLLLQFPYFSKKSGMTPEAFLALLDGFLPSLPDGYRFALEVRNKTWLTPRLLDRLRKRSVALTLIDHPWMPRIDRLMEEMDPVTADFTYVRWLGDRKGIEKTTTSWDRVVVDRSAETRRWIPALRKLLERDLTVFGFFNNHYAGHAPGSIRLLERLWAE